MRISHCFSKLFFVVSWNDNFCFLTERYSNIIAHEHWSQCRNSEKHGTAKISITCTFVCTVELLLQLYTSYKRISLVHTCEISTSLSASTRKRNTFLSCACAYASFKNVTLISPVGTWREISISIRGRIQAIRMTDVQISSRSIKMADENVSDVTRTRHAYVRKCEHSCSHKKKQKLWSWWNCLRLTS